MRIKIIFLMILGWVTRVDAQVNTDSSANSEHLLLLEPEPFYQLPLSDLEIQSKTLRIVNLHSTTVLPKGSFELAIQHRFGALEGGIDKLWGIDNLNSMRVGFDYGITNDFTAGIGRSSLKKTFNGYVKYKLIGSQISKFNLTYLADMAIDGRAESDWGLNPLFTTHRLIYTHSLLLSYKVSDKLFVGLNPTLVHFNYVQETVMSNDIPVIAGYIRVGATKHLNFTLEASQIVGLGLTVPQKENPSVGIGVEYFTPNHAFQISLSNTRSFNEPYFMVEDSPSNAINQFCLGFNIVRRW